MPAEAAGLTAWAPWLCEPALQRVCRFLTVRLGMMTRGKSADGARDLSRPRGELSQRQGRRPTHSGRPPHPTAETETGDGRTAT